jgi:hypothetical protein
MKKLYSIILATFIALSISNAQTNTIPSITNSGDASALLSAYLAPIGESIGAGLNAGWYQTAKPHKLGGFDISLNINLVNIPDAKRSFDDSQLQNFNFSNSTPTILGEGEGATVSYTGSADGTPITFRMPDQTDLTNKITSIPVPTLNVGVGLIKGTELDLRYIPEFELGSFSGNLWGVGLKHDVLQWIPLANKLPFDLSVQGAITQFNTSQTIEGTSNPLELNTLASNFNLIISKKFLMLTAYGSVGYNTSSTTLSAGQDLVLGIQDFDVSIPIEEVTFESDGEFKANLGLRLQLAILTVNVNQTFSEYPITTFGLGISFR